MWNIQRGNHCVCDRGYKYNEETQQCCAEGDSACFSNSRYCQCERQNGNHPTECSESNENSTVTPKVLEVIKDEVAAAVANAGGHSASIKIADDMQAALNQDTLELPQFEEGEEELGKDEKGRLDHLIPKNQPTFIFSKGYAWDVVADPKLIVDGPELVSSRCTGHNAATCGTKPGCMWESGRICSNSQRDGQHCRSMTDCLNPGEIRSRGIPSVGNPPRCAKDKINPKYRCVDAASWQCGVKKKIIDCAAVRDFSPADMWFFADQPMGRLILNQPQKWVKRCRFGLRNGEICAQNEDCPPAPGEVADARQQCDRVKLRKGTQAASQRACDDFELQQLAAMVV